MLALLRMYWSMLVLWQKAANFRRSLNAAVNKWGLRRWQEVSDAFRDAEDIVVHGRYGLSANEFIQALDPFRPYESGPYGSIIWSEQQGPTILMPYHFALYHSPRFREFVKHVVIDAKGMHLYEVGGKSFFLIGLSTDPAHRRRLDGRSGLDCALEFIEELTGEPAREILGWREGQEVLDLCYTWKGWYFRKPASAA